MYWFLVYLILTSIIFGGWFFLTLVYVGLGGKPKNFSRDFWAIIVWPGTLTYLILKRVLKRING